MDIYRTSAGARAPRTTAIAAAGLLLLGLAACQSGAVSGPENSPRPVVKAQAGLDLDRPADRLEEEIERQARGRGFEPGCVRYVLIEHGTAWRVLCVQRAS